MKAAIIDEYGSNDVLKLIDLHKPKAGEGQILVKVEAAGVNPIDWKIRSGAGIRLGMVLPIHMGSELVGTVEEVGAGVERFRRGERVYSLIHSGAFAEYAVVNAADVAYAPVNLTAVQAAALPLAGLTAWQALFDKAGLVSGQRLMITNSSGGVGSLAVQFAKAVGAHVTAVTSSRNADFVRGLGADEVIDYTQQPFEENVKDMDVVFDTVGGDAFERSFQTLKKGGHLVTAVALPSDDDHFRGVNVTRAFTVPSAKQLSAIAALVERGKVSPHVGTIMNFAKIKDALTLSEAGRSRGKIVLVIAYDA